MSEAPGMRYRSASVPAMVHVSSSLLLPPLPLLLPLLLLPRAASSAAQAAG